MSTTDTRKETRDIWASIVAFGVAGVLVVIHLANSVFGRAFIHPVAIGLTDIADGEKIPWSALNGGQIAYFGIGMAIQTIALLVMGLMLAQAATDFLRNRAFTLTFARRLNISGWMVLAYLIGGFIEDIGANWVAATYGVENWQMGFYGQDFTIMYVMLMALSLFGVALKRAARMQDDQEGLI